MASDTDADQNKLISLVILMLALREDTPTRQEVEEVAKAVAVLTQYDGDLEPIIYGTETRISIRMAAGISLLEE